MAKKRKNNINSFYHIFSDMKNNINTLIKDLYENKNDLESYTRYKPTVLKSKYPDLKKLGILVKKNKWEITDVGNKLLEIYESNDNEELQKLIASILGTYNYNGFRPYAVFIKFLYLKYSTDKYLDRQEIIKYLSLPINEVIYFINNKKNSQFQDINSPILIEAKRPLSYAFNHLINAGLIMKEGENLKLSENVTDFLDIFFSDLDSIPKTKKEIIYKGYRIIGRGIDQVTFRNELLGVYNGKCALTGKVLRMNNNNLLEAAHIIPVSHGGSYDVTNGILMTSDLHKAFDIGAFTINEEFNILVHPSVYEENYLPESKKINYLPIQKNNYPSLLSIKYHRDYIYGIGVLNSKNNEIINKKIESPYVNKFESIKVPLVGSAPCGDPLLGEQNIEEMIDIDKSKIRPGVKYFILRASGDSMNLAGINDGDLVLCRYSEKGETGDKVVALLGGEKVTIKFYDKKDGLRILLPKSTNKIHQSIIPEEGDSVQGIVQEVIKRIDKE